MAAYTMRDPGKILSISQSNCYTSHLPNTKRIQANIQISMAVRVSALGEFVVTLLKMLTSTRNSVIRRAILPDKELRYFYKFC